MQFDALCVCVCVEGREKKQADFEWNSYIMLLTYHDIKWDKLRKMLVETQIESRSATKAVALNETNKANIIWIHKTRLNKICSIHWLFFNLMQTNCTSYNWTERRTQRKTLVNLIIIYFAALSQYVYLVVCDVVVVVIVS